MKNSSSINKFRDKLMKNGALRGEIIDAQVCMGVALQLYRLRIYRNVTQKELADMLGVTQSNIARWESPGYQGYKVKVLSKIARTLGGKLTVNIEPIVKNFSIIHSYNSHSPTPSLINRPHGAQFVTTQGVRNVSVSA